MDEDHLDTPDEGDSDAVGRLLDFAGSRPEAPPDFAAEVKRRTHLVWQAKVEAHARARRRREQLRWLAAAAVLALAVGLFAWQRGRETDSIIVAKVEAFTGAGGLAVGDGLAAGSEIETAVDGRASLRLAGGASLRLDGATLVLLESPAVLALRRGAVYLDSGPEDGGGLEVRTPYGVARDVGTQFEVRLRDAGLEIRVREGAVELEARETVHRVEAGGLFSIAGDGTVAFEATPGYGPQWSWVLAAAPSFDTEGRTLGEFLDWVVRETGWRTRFADPELEEEVRPTRIYGSIPGLAPDQAPEVVLPSSGLDYRLEDGTLVIERR